MHSIDLNCDLGEDSGNDDLIMPFVSSVNIACGYHAGDPQTIWQTLELASKHKVAPGAHVSFLDRENFGRRKLQLTSAEIYELVEQQLIIIYELADPLDLRITHVKPHGALYNMSAADAGLAETIARAIKDFDEKLVLVGLSGSHSIKEAKKAGLSTISEVFADRRYNDDGTLVSRDEINALISDSQASVRQVLGMIRDGKVETISGKTVDVKAETICLHGEGPDAVEIAKQINTALKENSITVRFPFL